MTSPFPRRLLVRLEMDTHLPARPYFEVVDPVDTRPGDVLAWFVVDEYVERLPPAPPCFVRKEAP